MGKFYIAGLILLVLLLIESTQFCLCQNSGLKGCIDAEREALLKLKQSFQDPSHLLSSWTITKTKDCCKWKGVSCSGRRVVKLDFGSMKITNWYEYYSENIPTNRLVASEIKSGLLELRYLNYLDLSRIDFQGIPIPKLFGSMERLRYLNLSCTNFSGIVPQQLGNLTNLRVLDLSDYESGLTIQNLDWVSHLSSLQHLDISGADISGARNFMKVINMLHSLLVLSLSDCGLNNNHLSQVYTNSTFLPTVEYLDLSGNSFQVLFPHVLQNMTSLKVFDLSYNSFNSSIPLLLGNFKSLVHLNLAGNMFNTIEGGLLTVLWTRCYLKSLDLSGNLLHGELLGTYRNLSGCVQYDLEALNLGGNELIGHLPDWLGQFKKLKCLDLTGNQLNGAIPAIWEKLYMLRELDLSSNRLNGTIPETLGKLYELRELDLSSNQLNGAIPKTLGKLYALRELNLLNNQLNGSIPETLENLSELRKLNLFNNQLNGAIPAIWEKLSMLRELDLSFNQLNGTIPETLGKLYALRELKLSNNQFNGAVPDSLGQLSNLEILDISSNSFEGKLSEVHFANLSRLEDFRIAFNNLAFKLKSDWLPPFQLKSIAMWSCKIGTIPQWLGTQKHITKLYLSNASISGPMPKWFGDLHVSILDLSHNQISGPLPQYSSDMMPALVDLNLDDNLINGTIPSSWCNIKTLLFLKLSNNRLSGKIPNCWKNLLNLFLSNNSLSGNAPDGLGTLFLVDLSNNMLSGNIPNFGSGVTLINLSSNKLTGAIPRSIGHLANLEWLHLRNNSLNGELPLALRTCTNLKVLDLGENGFFGNIPTWIGESLLSLRILRLRKNILNGSIPPQICQLSALQILDLANNNLTGAIPHCFGNFNGMIWKQVIDLRNDPLIDGVKVIEVMKGMELEFSKILPLVVNMDLSSNNLVGTIPKEITILTGLVGLNLSHNHLRGNIPKNIGNLMALESLDISENLLSGSIPQSLAGLNFLSHLNLSYNNFSGHIPTGNQLQTLVDPSIYAGNSQLCGAPQLKKCPADEPPPAPTLNGYERKDEEDESKKVWFYIVIMLGYMTGLWGVIGVLLLKKSWRYAYFRFVDETKDRIFVAIAMKANWLKKKMGRNHAAE